MYAPMAIALIKFPFMRIQNIPCNHVKDRLKASQF
jgi:hypothetical protein